MEKAEELKKAFERRKKLDDKVDSILTYWRRNHKRPDNTFWLMVEELEEEFPETGIACYPEAKLIVKIHDGEQTFT